MAFYRPGFRTLDAMGVPAAALSPGNTKSWHTYTTNDDRATVETANYFDDLLLTQAVKKGDIIGISFDVDTDIGVRLYGINIVSAHVVLVPAIADDSGTAYRAMVATADGLTTGLIKPDDRAVIITNGGSANNWSTLPPCSAATIGREINILASAANSELRTTPGGTETINNVACGVAANEALLTAGNFYKAIQTLATGWILIGWTNLGAVQTAIVPDA